MKTRKKRLKKKPLLEVGDVVGVVGKPFDKSDLIELISQFSELRCQKILILVDFVAGNSNKLKTLEFGRKNQW
jgi:hypothetical protein